MRLFTDPAGAWGARPRPYRRFFRWCVKHDEVGLMIYLGVFWAMIFGLASLLKWWLA